MIMTMINGLSMALADSVPGVSGGTIAFIMGFYDQFLNAVQCLFVKDKEQRKSAVLYLAKFCIGWGLGMGASVLLLSHIFEKNIYFLSSLFLGLTVSAIPFILYEERITVKGQYKNLLYTFLGIALVVLLSVMRVNSSGLSTLNFEHLTILQYGYLFFSGILAISAMLLPGISGSTLLLILGIYVPAISAVKEILHFHIQYLPGVIALAAGVLFGIILVSKLICKLLARFRTQMVYLIFGLMLGSLYAIIMGPTTLDIPKPPVDFSSFNAIAFCIGIAILVGLEVMKRITPLSKTQKDF